MNIWTIDTEASKRKKILALDLGTKTGWAYYNGENIISGWWDLSLQRGDSQGMCFLYLESKLDIFLLTRSKPDIVIFERAHHRGGAATQKAIGFATRVLAWCAQNGIEHTDIHSGTLKKYATGSGRADKNKMIELAEKKWEDQEIETDDQADALWILDWGMEKFK